MVHICNCIVGLRLRVNALIFLFLSIFLSFPMLHADIKICFSVFSGTIKARILIYLWTMSCIV